MTEADNLALQIVQGTNQLKHLKRQARFAERNLALLKEKLSQCTKSGDIVRIPDHNGEIQELRVIRTASIRQRPQHLTDGQVAALKEIGVYCEPNPQWKHFETGIRKILPNIQDMAEDEIRDAIGDTLYNIIKVETKLELGA